MINDGVSNLCVVPSCVFFYYCRTATTMATAVVVMVAAVAVFAVWRKIKSVSLILKATYSHFSSVCWAFFFSRFDVAQPLLQPLLLQLLLLFFHFSFEPKSTTKRLRFMTYACIRRIPTFWPFVRSEIIHDMDCFKLNAQIVYKHFFFHSSAASHFGRIAFERCPHTRNGM